ncbi:MAG: hypothetical protein GVY36_08865 [Verrucomicrobia bacterium]|nr:hypothetical protein [Verrucomicrobiota bacterium]
MTSKSSLFSLSRFDFHHSLYLAAAILLGAANAQGQSYTYVLDGTFVDSDWNADSTNAIRTLGGPFSGFFTIDTGSLTVTELEIGTTFYSISGSNQVVTSGTYNFGLGGTDDEMGTASGRSINLGSPTLPVFIGLTTKLDGTANFNGRTGSIIQIMDKRPTSSRIYRPRLTVFMENMDFTNADGESVSAELLEQVWNINRGTGRAGFSGSQGSTEATAVPEPATFALGLGVAALAFVMASRRGKASGES